MSRPRRRYPSRPRRANRLLDSGRRQQIAVVKLPIPPLAPSKTPSAAEPGARRYLASERQSAPSRDELEVLPRVHRSLGCRSFGNNDLREEKKAPGRAEPERMLTPGRASGSRESAQHHVEPEHRGQQQIQHAQQDPGEPMFAPPTRWGCSPARAAPEPRDEAGRPARGGTAGSRAPVRDRSGPRRRLLPQEPGSGSMVRACIAIVSGSRLSASASRSRPAEGRQRVGC